MCEDGRATQHHRSALNMLPRMMAEIVFLTPSEGGRRHPLRFDREILRRHPYMPHMVIQDRGVRHALVDANCNGLEDYLGVSFRSGPDDYSAGQSAHFELELMYHPRLNYDVVQPGATFTIREGGKIVGHGEVIERIDASETAVRQIPPPTPSNITRFVRLISQISNRFRTWNSQ